MKKCITTANFEQLKGKIFNEIKAQYKQPDWCDYPEAIDPMGCWSLIYGKIRSKKDCKNCELNKENIGAKDEQSNS